MSTKLLQKGRILKKIWSTVYVKTQRILVMNSRIIKLNRMKSICKAVTGNTKFYQLNLTKTTLLTNNDHICSKEIFERNNNI